MITFFIAINEVNGGIEMQCDTPRAQATPKEIKAGMALKDWLRKFPMVKTIKKDWRKVCQ